jgi:chaperonin cofactor prefoldin
MPQVERINSGAVIIKYSEHELEDHVGYRLMKLEGRLSMLEKRVEKLELLVNELIEKFYISYER